MTVDLKVDLKVDVKVDLKVDLKLDLKVTLKEDLKVVYTQKHSDFSNGSSSQKAGMLDVFLNKKAACFLKQGSCLFLLVISIWLSRKLFVS